MRRPDPNVFPTLLCAAIVVAGAGGVAAGTQLQRMSAGDDSRSLQLLPSVQIADAQPSYRFIDDQPKLEPIQQPSIDAPKFSRIVIEKTGVSRLEGNGTPGSQVLIKSAGRMIAAAVVDPEGRWAVTLERDLKAGDHSISSVAAGGDTTLPGDEVRVFIPTDFAGREIVAYDRTRVEQSSSETGSVAQNDDATSKRAQDLANAATQRFSEIVAPLSSSNADEPRIEVAQNSEAPAAKPDPSAPTEPNVVTDFLSSGAAAVQNWMRQSGETYDREIARPLSVPTGTDTAAASPEADEPRIKQPRPSVDASGTPAEAAHKIKLERERAAKALRDAEVRDQADAAKQAEEAKRRQADDAAARARDADRAAADQARKAAEAKKIVEGMKRLEAAQRAEEARKEKEVAAAPKAAEEDAKPAKRLEFTIEDGSNTEPREENNRGPREDDGDRRENKRRDRDSSSNGERQAMLEERQQPSSDTGSRVGGWRASNDFDARRARSCSAGSLRRHGRKTVYVVQPGDTLWAIAGRHYRHGSRYNIIYRANTHRLSSPDLIMPCQRLVLPWHGRRRHG